MATIKTILDPIIRQKIKPVEVFDGSLDKLGAQMRQAMHKHIGMGLAANQINVDKRVIVFEYKQQGPDDENKSIPFTVMCNPEIGNRSTQKSVMAEACLSVPGIEADVLRSDAIAYTFQDTKGRFHKQKTKGLLAKIIQHEVDHLDGVVFTDRAGKVDLKSLENVRIVFFGSDDFSLTILKSLVNNRLNVVGVVTEADKPSGRGNQLKSTPVKEYAQRKNIPISFPNSKAEISQAVQEIEPHLIILASYGKILPTEALEFPTYKSINIHPSLLPKYRGATPIQTAILNGDKQTGVSVMQMSAGVDEGGLIAAKTVEISDTDDYALLKEKLARAGSELLLKVLPNYLIQKTKPIAQNEAEVTKTTKLSKEMGKIDWNDEPQKIVNQIKALNPWPGTYTTLGDLTLQVKKAKLTDQKVQIIEVQLQGKNKTNWPDFVRGYEKRLTLEPWYTKIYKQC